MRTVKILLIITGLVVFAAYGALHVKTALFTDTTPPSISFDSDPIEISVYDEESALLSGVSARDNADGDLSGDVMISSISQFISENTVQVSYIVFDSSDNSSTATRTAVYTDYVPPRFALSEPLVFTPSSDVVLGDALTVTDVLDGDITGNIQLVDNTIILGVADIYSVSLQVTNSRGDVAQVTLPVIIQNTNAQYPILRLTDALVYVPVDSYFDPAAYFYGVREDGIEQTAAVSEEEEPVYTDEEGFRPSMDGVIVESTVNTAVPGSYQVCYTYENAKGYITRVALAVVVV